MIDRLKILNFQSHKRTRLNFSPGLNVIVGPSDSGKTAVLRALKWLVWNRPQGNAFRSDWGGRTQVDMELGDITISRIKGQSGDVYKLNDSEFRAFRTDVPDEIVQALNFDQINLQTQFTQPFLVSQSPGEVARYLNEIAHLDQIDIGISNVNKWIKNLSKDITSEEARVESMKEELAEYDYLDEFESDLEVLEVLEGQRGRMDKSINRLSDLISNLSQVRKSINKIESITEMEPLVDSVLELMEQKKDIKSTNTKIQHILDDILIVDNELGKLQDILQAEKQVDKIIELYNDRNKIYAECTIIENLIHELDMNGQRSATLQKTHDDLHKEFDELLGDTCPICNSKIH